MVSSLQPLRAAPGITAIAGKVRLLDDQPLEGVTLRVGSLAARTDQTGRFLLISISSGHQELVIDGRTASRPGRVYGVFKVGIDVRANRTNILPYTIWMPEIDTKNAVSIPSPTTDEVAVTNPYIPGLELHLPPGTIIRDEDGQIVTEISITPVPVDRPPFPLPFGTEFPMYFTVQPGGAYIDRLFVREPYGAEGTTHDTVSYAYDAVGRRTSMTVQGQSPVTYIYDDADRLTQIAQGTSAVDIAYDAASRPVSLTLPGGVIAEYDYDAASQLNNVTYQRAGTVLGDLIYAYDAAGNCVRVDGSFARTTIPEAVFALAYDAANQLIQKETTSLSYDANGNLTNDGVRSYVWNARNQLATINGTGVTASFEYDAFGRRTRKTVNGTTTEFLYDGFNIVQEASGGTPTASLLMGLGIDEYFVRTTADGSQILLFNALGSTVALLDSNGVLKTEYAYEPFGATSATGSSTTNPFQYTGRENDASGLYNYRARYYSPALRRFISEDPLGLAGGDINLYAYALSSPTNFTDPLGLGGVDVMPLTCLDQSLDAWKRKKQMETSGRKGEEVEEVKKATEEMNRTMFEMIACLSPVGMIFPFYPKPPLPDEPKEWPKGRGDPRYDTPPSWQRGREEWNREYGDKELKDAIRKYSRPSPRPGRLQRIWRWLRGLGRR
jgi:RHS repeat-associated protein